MPQEPQTEEQRIVLIRQTLESKAAQGEIEKALPRSIVGLDAAKLARIAMTAVQKDTTGKLIKCDPVSILSSLVQAAQIGLVTDGFLGQAYLIPFWNGKRNCDEAKLMIGYRGFIELAIRSGRINQVRSVLVYENDAFRYEEGLVPILTHIPEPDPKKRGNLMAVYAIADLKGVPRNESPFRVMFAEEVLRIRDSSPSAHDRQGNLVGAWKTHEGEMWRKTAVRALAKYISLSPELTTAAVIDEYNEAGVTIEGDAGAVSVVDRPESHPQVSSDAVASLKQKISGIKAASELRTTSVVEQSNQPVEEEALEAIPTSVNDEAAGDGNIPNPEFVEYNNGHFVSGTVTEVSDPKLSKRKQAFLVVTMTDQKFYCYVEPLFQFLSGSEGEDAIFQYEPGEYKKITGIRRIGKTEFEDNVPVIQLKEEVEEVF